MSSPSSPPSGPESDPRPSAAGTPPDRAPRDAQGPRPVTPYDETVKYASPPAEARPGSVPPPPEEVAQAPSSARFGKFIRTRRLGSGGMGEVWKAWDCGLARWVALKFLKGGDDDEIARFRREAQTAGRLHHPNIAAIFEVGEDQGRHYIAMQYVEGQTLLTFPRVDRVLLGRLVSDAARAVQYAHEQGIVHRDLKPENIMVRTRSTPESKSPECHVYVMDFGLARPAEGASRLTVSGIVVGTPSYMAPEQARGERVDARSDVYSLGATLYELLTDRRPFEASNIYETLKRVQDEDPVPPRRIDSKIPVDLETIVLKCLSKDPGHRYPSAQVLAEDLDLFGAGESIRARPEGFSGRLWRRIRRNPILTATMTLLLLAAVGTGLVARRASRDRSIHQITQRLDSLLGAREWTESAALKAEAVVAELSAVSPDDALRAREQLVRELERSFQAALSAGDLGRARSNLEILDRRDASNSRKRLSELRRRESLWQTTLKLEPPFGALGEVFEAGRIRSGVEGLLRTSPAPNPLPLRQACQGHVELKAEFGPSWRKAWKIGLGLNTEREEGYALLLLTHRDPTESPAGTPAPPSFEEAMNSKGLLWFQIRRKGSLLYEERRPADEAMKGALLVLRGKREGDRLTFQVNDGPTAEFTDPFAPTGAKRGVFSLYWPEGVELRRIVVSRQDLAPLPRSLDLGDELFLQEKYNEALEKYREASQASPAIGPEARYKEGICQLRLNRKDEARAVFEDVAREFYTSSAGGEKRWSFLSDCQLLLLYFAQKDQIDRATGILDKLKAYGFSFEMLAPLIPQEVRSTIIDNTFIGTIGANLSRKPEEMVARLEFAVKTSRLLEPPAHRAPWVRHGLLRAYLLADRPLDALRMGQEMFDEFGYGGQALDDVCWIHRLRGEVSQALDMISKGVAAEPFHLVERSRIHAALGRWEDAQKDLDSFFSKPSDYYYYSEACLLQGFLLERRGESQVRVEEAWRKGLWKAWKASASSDREVRIDRSPEGTPMLHHWILSSLTNDMTDQEAQELLAGLVAFTGKDNPVFSRLTRPSMLRSAWRTPRGHEVARHVAFLDFSFQGFAYQPLYVGWVAFLHETCFPPEPLSAQQDELLWGLAQEIQKSYLAGVLNERYLLPFGAIVQGNPNLPGMGWKEVSTLLDHSPRLRGPLAYVFGQRYLKRADEKNARMFFEAALRDATTNPADLGLLEQLTRAELKKLDSP